MRFLQGLNWVCVLGIVVAVETQFGNGSMSLVNMIPDLWIPGVKAWMANLGSIGALIMSAGAFGRVPSAQAAQIPPAVKALILAGATAWLLMGGTDPASAQTRLRAPAVTGNIGADLKADLANAGIKTPTVAPGAACDFNIFAALQPTNVVTTIQNCVSDASKPFLPDVQAALDSATTYKDKPGIDCLTPALAIVQAAVGKPAVTVPDGSVTTPGQVPGVILIFQKFREFTLANGPAACKNWVQSTVNGTVSNAL
jgi:hypothetical protein